MDDLAAITPPASLAEIERRTAAFGFPMPSERLTGALLRALAAAKPGGQLLELGTGTGLATAWMLDGMDSRATLVTVDIDPGAQAIARALLGTDPRLTIVTEDAAAFLARLTASGIAGAGGGFDLIFADAMIGKYEMLDETLALLRPGGFYLIDDMLPQASWPEGHAPKVPHLLATLAARPDLRLATLAWSSGVAVAVRRG
ncbi:MAG TPA: class I SAM-dependent methyltransferase [Acetobacteraceae bacterium]|jgi:predicted O-methyltransferase YrrM|nr:class I SAM-dependent methyltransferase [Acetobacteraceae bacterium]